MPLFARRKEATAQSFIISLLNQNCRSLQNRMDGPRVEGRVNLTLVVMIVPVEDDVLQVRKAFTATTKEFSSTGVAVVVTEPWNIDDVMLGFRWRGTVTWIRAKARHVHPMGGDFFHLGLRMIERIIPAEYPELARILF